MKRKTLLLSYLLALFAFTTTAVAQTFDSGKAYMLKHVNSGLYLYLHPTGTYTETSLVNATTLRSLGTWFTISGDESNGFTLTEQRGTYTLGLSSSYNWNTSSSVATTWTIAEVSSGSGTYYITSAKGYLGTTATAAGTYIYTNLDTSQSGREWQIVEATSVATTPTDGMVVSLYNAPSDGKLYPFTATVSSSQATVPSTTTEAPQLFALEANGTDTYGATLYKMAKAENDGNYLYHKEQAYLKNIYYTTTAGNFIFMNSSSDYNSYTATTGSKADAPYCNLVQKTSHTQPYSCYHSQNNGGTYDGWSTAYDALYFNGTQAVGTYNSRWFLKQEPYSAYTVSVSGLDDASSVSVSYSGTDPFVTTHTAQADGGTFYLNDYLGQTADKFSATEVSGYTCGITLSGTTINVTYTSYDYPAEDGKVYAIYNVTTDGAWPVYNTGSAPRIATSTSTTPQLLVAKANGTDANTSHTVFNLAKAEGDGNYLAWTAGTPSSVAFSSTASNFTFVNGSTSGYTWTTGTAPVSPLVNFVGYTGTNYTVFCDNNSTSSNAFNGWSNRAYNQLYNNAQAAKGSGYCTTWALVEQPYTVYTLAVSGLDDASGVSVSYSNASDVAITRSAQANGGFFAISDDVTPDASMFTATDVSEYTYAVSISGTTVTVTYTSASLEPVYTLSTPARGSVFCKSDGAVLYGSNSSSYGETFDASNTRFQFAFIESQYLGRTFLYNVGTGQFVYSATSSSSTIPTSTSVNYTTGQVTMLASTNNTYAETYPDVIKVGDYQINLSTGGTGVYSWNDVSDAGNCLLIEAVSTADLTSAYTAVNNAELDYLNTLLGLAGTTGYPATTTTLYTNLLALKNAVEAGTASDDTDANRAIVEAYLNPTICEEAGYSEFNGTTVNFSNTKVYFLLPYDNSRGTFYYDANTTDYMYTTNKAGIALDPTDVKQQLAFITVGNNSYIYSIGAQKFFTNNGSQIALTSVPTSASLISMTLSTGAYTSYPWVFKADNAIFGISNGYDYPVITTWQSTADGGNCMRVFEVGDIDAESYWNALDGIYNYEGQTQKTYTINYVGLPSGTSSSVTIGGITRTTSLTTYIPYGTSPFSAADIVAPAIDDYSVEVSVSGTTITVTYTSTLTSEVEITYNYTYNGTIWYTETKSAVVGQPYPDIYPQPSGVKYTTSPVGIVSGTETFEITCELLPSYAIIPSESFSNATWVYFSIYDSYSGAPKYLHYDYTHENYLAVSETTPVNAATYKWAFVGNPFTGTYKIYNQAAGSSMILTSTDPTLDNNTGGSTYIHLAEESGLTTDYNTEWNLTESALGFYLSRAGETVYANTRNSQLAYWTTSADGGSRVFIVPIEAKELASSLIDSEGNAISSSAQYYIVNRHTGKTISNDDNYLTSASTGTADTQLWTITANGTGYYLKNASDKYATGGPASQSWANTAAPSTDATTMYLYTARNADGIQYYYINDAASVTNSSTSLRHFLGDDGSYIRSRGAALGSRMEWYFVKYEADEPTYATSISSGKYYRLVSNAYPTLSMTDTGGKVAATTTDADSYAQVWKITKSGSTYTLQNMLTGKYISTAPGTSVQWSTVSSSGGSFYSGTTTSDSNTLFWFATQNSTTSYNSLHAAATQSYYVVGWRADADASKWLLQEVTLSNSDLAAIADLQDETDYTSTLTTFFDDYACTQLKSTYAAMTDAQLRTDMSALPSDVIEEAVRVKNNTWNSNSTWNTYEKDFRIHAYDAYNEPSVWGSKLGYGSFGRLAQPTGIKVSANEAIYIFVDEAADDIDSDGHLYAELVSGVNITGTQIALTKGYNKIVGNSDCEIFITYNVSNTEKALSSYPDVNIHIAGGTCSGAFDMNRGHTNNDWYWLANNMFSDEYLHIRSNHHVFCCYLDRVKDASNITQGLSIWDWVFATEETVMSSYFGGDYYRPIMTVYDDTSGNPNWSGGSNGRVMIPGIYSGSFVANNMVTGEGKWVISHEEGHGHQAPYNLAGTTEASNNSLGQIVEYLWGYRTSRGTAQKELVEMYNEGFCWVDMVRATNRYTSTYMNDASYNTGGWSNIGSKSIWLINKMWYQLWLYFHLKGDDGFYQRFIAQLVADGGIVKGSSASSPTSYKTDYMRLALAACKAANTDLYEFFKVWGFFRYGDEDADGTTGTGHGINTNKTIYTSVEDFTNNDGTLGDGLYYIGDYGGYYMQMPVSTNNEDVAYMEAARAEMQAYPNKAPGILFINDTGELQTISADKECVKYDASLEGVTQVYYDTSADDGAGCTGHYSEYGSNEAASLDFTVSGTTVTVTGGGAVGYKIYDASGELVYVAMSNEFTVSSTIATGLTNGTYTFVASLGDDTDLILAAPNATTYTMTVYNGSSDADSIQTYLTAGILASSKSGDLATYATGDFVAPYDSSNPDNAVATLNHANNNSLPAALRNLTNVIYNGTTGYNMVFTDKLDYYAPSTFTATTVNYARTNTGGYNTVCLPFNVQASEFTSVFGSDAKVYVLTAMDGTNITFSETANDVAAGTPMLVYNESTTSWDFSRSSRSATGTAGTTDASGATLTGAFQGETIGTGHYKLNSAGTRFVRTTATSTITPFRFYLDAASGSGIRQFIISFEDLDETITTIGAVQTDDGTLRPADIYDLQGRRVTQPQRGQIYIVGGKKVRY
ncbi:MAG: M60 family metallopeptidase [Bacteroidaceae bacterium]|nr:M60 family metallopeptidase [Bacteroidaceae bacterium]